MLTFVGLALFFLLGMIGDDDNMVITCFLLIVWGLICFGFGIIKGDGTMDRVMNWSEMEVEG